MPLRTLNTSPPKSGDWLANLLRAVIAGLLMLLFLHGHGWAQGSPQAGQDVYDRANKALKVNVVAGGGTGGGPSDAAASASASESDVARQKVTSALRLLDTSQAAGSQLVTAKGDQTSGLFVNCKAGCTGAADTTGSTVALNALNAAALVTLAGDNSASVLIAGSGSLVGTLVPEVSNDGGTTWFATYFEDPATHALTTSQAVSSPAATMLSILLPGGADRARVRVSVFTSGSSSATLKATGQFPNRPLKVSSVGVLSVDGSGVTQPISAVSLPLPTGAAADSSLTTLDTDVKANITLHAGTNVIGHVIADSGSTTAVTGNVAVTKADGSDVTLGAKGDAKNAATDTTAISAMSVLKQISASVQAPPSQAVTNAGTFAVQAATTIADGADTTLGAKGDAKSTATDTTAVSAISVLKEISALEQAPASRAVTNAGTFAVQIPANSSVNVAQVAGTTTDTNSGTKSAGTLRVVLATDQPALTNKLLVTPDSVALPANQSVNLNQVAGAATSATNPLYTRETDGTNPVILDPCRTQANIFKPFSQTASAQLVTGTSAKKIYICSINLVTAAANNVAMVEGTGTVCATGIAGMAGGTTAATGWNFAANGGLTQGNGMGSIMAEATNADNLCLLQSAAVQLSGVIGYVVQ